jgi:hypothetical protein
MVMVARMVPLNKLDQLRHATLHFECMIVEWVPRASNTVADAETLLAYRESRRPISLHPFGHGLTHPWGGTV